jgi:hypothetical protein
MLISLSLGRTQLWRPAKWELLCAASLTWFSLAVMVPALFSLRPGAGALRVPIGRPNRFLIVAYCNWLMIVAWHEIRLRGRDGGGQRCANLLAPEATSDRRST